MDLKDLTPELFEKTEFAEKRRGYDIDQVENFLEETGTALAQLLVRHRQLEERASTAEARLADAEARLADAEARLAQQGSAPAPTQATESDEVERATSTLLMAKRTADATIAEAEAEAGRVRAEATRRAEEIVAEARRTAEEELHTARRHTTEVVTSLEARRDAVASVVEGFEQRIEDYRSQLAEAADSLRAIVDDPAMLAAREPVQVPPAAAGHTPTADAPANQVTTGDLEQPGAGREAGYDSGAYGNGGYEGDPVDLTDATQAHDTASLAREDLQGTAGVAPGSEGASPGPVEAQVRESSVVVDAEPVTGQTSDRFLRELDEAVNESREPAGSGDEDAMSAFFGGESSEGGRSRFGWRR